VFYSFPDSTVSDAAGDVPDEYMVVSGADYKTYEQVLTSPNRVHSTAIAINTGKAFRTPHSLVKNNFAYEVLFARKDDLEPAP
jgi:hypothetical protein